MSPRTLPRSFPLAIRFNQSVVDSALAAAAPFLKIEPWDWSNAEYREFQIILVQFDSSRHPRSLAPGARRRSIDRTINAFQELRDALVSIDYPMQRKIADLHDLLSEPSQQGLSEFSARLHYDDYTQRYWRDCRAWIEGLTILRELPREQGEARNAQTPRDYLIARLRETFKNRGRRRRGVLLGEQETRFINAVLKALSAKPTADPSRRVRALTQKESGKAKATKRAQE